MKIMVMLAALVISTGSFAASWECSALCVFEDRGRIFLLDTSNQDNDAMVYGSNDSPSKAIAEMKNECDKRLSKKNELARRDVGFNAYPVTSLGRDYKSGSNNTELEFATVKNSCVKL
ncbi:MAG: hypothetical protein VYA54_01235 [Bdellovibrionota bacterium]|nr:hypothetical protein [Bdellovibrionota bacterium]